MTPTETVGALLLPLPSVTLAEVNRQARLLTREDRKYLLRVGDAASTDAIIALANAGQENEAAVLDLRDKNQRMTKHRANGYMSVYLDTPDDRSFHLSAAGDPGRFKVRRRSYLDSWETYVEVKTRSEGQTVKRREILPETIGERPAIMRRFVRDELDAAGVEPFDVNILRAVLNVRYDRQTILLPQSHARVTIDTQVSATRHILPEAGGQATTHHYGDLIVVETKTPRGKVCEADVILQSRGFQPIRFSKYCTSRHLLEPALPAHRWADALNSLGGI